MTGLGPLDLPDYRAQAPEVAERFRRLRSEPVVVRIERLSKTFGGGSGAIAALCDVSCEVRRGELVSVIGPSGCGKSTLIRIVAGLEEPTEGRVLLDDAPVTGPGADRGMVFQGYTLFSWLTVKKNVMFGLRMKGVRRKHAEEEALRWLEIVGLSRFADQYPAALSGGMKQRVAIARALVNGPRVLLMDEPFAALDALTRARMRTHLLKIWRETDVTILFITHDLEEAIYLSDRIVAMDAHPGRVREVIEVPVPRPRSPDQFLSGPFLALKKRLEDLIHQRTSEDAEDEAME